MPSEGWPTPSCGELSQEWNVGANILLVVLEAAAKVGIKQAVFDTDANLRTGEEGCQGDEEQPPRRDQYTGAEKDAQHGCVDRVANDAVRALSHQFVVGVDAGVDAELFPEGAFGRPGEHGREDEESELERDLPGNGRMLPEMGLP